MELRDRNMEQPGIPVHKSGCRPCSLGLLVPASCPSALWYWWTQTTPLTLLCLSKTLPWRVTVSLFSEVIFFSFCFYLRVCLNSWFLARSCSIRCLVSPWCLFYPTTFFFGNFIAIYFSHCVGLISQASPSSLEPFFSDFIFVLPVWSSLGIKRNFIHFTASYCYFLL